jgi:Protein of unknown function (DUF1571)
MTEPRHSRRVARLVRKKLFWAVVAIPLGIAAVCGWLTEPLRPPGPVATSTPKIKATSAPVAKLADWPTAPMKGRPAMVLLLDSLLMARARLEADGGYTAILRKTERLKGKLGAEQVLEMKCRNDPFAIYFKYRTPEPGKEVVYAAGRYDDEVVAHGTGFSRALIPRLKFPPTSTLAMSGNRHPITDAGLLNLTNRLIGFREMDLKDPEAGTVLDRVRDDQGREWLRSYHTHPHQTSGRPFQVVEVLYDPVTRIPVRIKNYDWQAPGETGEPKLAEAYRYDELKLGAALTDADFDPANPAYAFSRSW